MRKLLFFFFFLIEDLYWICDFSQEKAIETPNGKVHVLSGELLKSLTAETAAFLCIAGTKDVQANGCNCHFSFPRACSTCFAGVPCNQLKA